jgi:hypothetical protein
MLEFQVFACLGFSYPRESSASETVGGQVSPTSGHMPNAS